MGNSRKVNIILTRTYSYPYSVLNRGNEVENALQKVATDLVTDIQEVVCHGVVDPNEFRIKLFETEVVEDPSFSFRIPVPQARARGTMTWNVQRLRESLAKSILEFNLQKRLDPERSPELFDNTPEIKNPETGEILQEAQTFLKRDIEQQLQLLRLHVEDWLYTTQ